MQTTTTPVRAESTADICPRGCGRSTRIGWATMTNRRWGRGGGRRRDRRLVVAVGRWRAERRAADRVGRPAPAWAGFGRVPGGDDVHEVAIEAMGDAALRRATYVAAS
jgi:hypothetical protein